MQLIPVDNDPFAAPPPPSGGPKLVPVNHDPFAHDRGATEAGVNHAANQALFGIGPQVGGAIQGVLDWTGLDSHRGGADRAAPGTAQPRTVKELAASNDKPAAAPEGSFRGGYNRFVDRANANLDAEAAMHPVASTVGDVAGGLASMAAIPEARIAQGLGIAGKAGTIGAKVGEGIAGGLTYGLASGAGNARGGAGDRLKGALEGGLTGLVAGGASPVIGKVIGKVAGEAAKPFKAVADAIGGAGGEGAAPRAAGEAERRVGAALTIDNANDPQAAVRALQATQKIGAPVIAADMGNTTRRLARAASNVSPEGQTALEQKLAERSATEIDRATHVIDQAAPFTDAAAVQEKLDAAAVRLKKPAYDKAYQEGDRPIWSPEMERLVGSQAVQDAMKGAVTKGKDRAIQGGFGAFNPGVTVTKDGQLIFNKGKSGVQTYPNLQYWDYVKRELDDAANQAARAGRNDEARVVGGLAKQLRTELDKQVPSYETARGTAAAFFNANDAAEAGRNFVTQRADNFIAAKAALAKFNPAERQIFAGNFASSLINRIRESGNLNIINAIQKSPMAKERMVLALGQNGADKIEAFVRLQNIMGMAKQAITGNSTTVRQLRDLGMITAGREATKAGLAGAVGVYQGGSIDPRSWDAKTFLEVSLAYGILHGRQAYETKVATEVAKLLASDDPEIVRKAIDRVGRSPRLMTALRIGESKLARIVVPLRHGGGRTQLPAVAAGVQPASADDNGQAAPRMQ